MIRTTVLEILYIKETEIIQTIGTDNVKTTDHEPIQTINQTIKIITLDHETILRIEIQIIQIQHRNNSESPHRKKYTISKFRTKL